MGFDPLIAVTQRGRLSQWTTQQYQANGTTGITYTYDGQSTVASVVTPQGWLVTYEDHEGTEADRLKSVTVANGSGTVIAKAEYWYQGNAADLVAPGTATTDLGSLGDLIQVKVSTKASADAGNACSIVRYTQYRYFKNTDAGGSDHQLKMVLESDAIERIIADFSDVATPQDILKKGDADATGSASGKAIQDFASRSFTYYKIDADAAEVTTPWMVDEDLQAAYGGAALVEYSASDKNGFVKTETVNGSCASCGGGSEPGGGIKRSYFYMSLNGSTTDPNEVARIVVEDEEDSTGAEVRRTVYGLNYKGVKLREAIIANPLASPLVAWCSSTLLTAEHRVAESRNPSAHTQVDTTGEVKTFLDPYDAPMSSYANDASTVSASAGLVHYFEYNAKGRTTGVRIRKGTGATNRYYVSATDYGDADGDGAGMDNSELCFVTATYEYPTATETRTAGKKTSYAYQFWDANDVQIKQITVTSPVIASGQNGSGTATTAEQYYDELGRLRWTKDGEGYVNYYSYNPTTGWESYRKVDVNNMTTPGSEIVDGDNSGAGGADVKWLAWTVDGADSNKPTRGTLPTGVELVSKEEYDDLGRGKLMIDSGGGKHYTLYETNRTVQLPYWDSTNTKSLQPTTVTVVDNAGQVTETYAIRGDSAGIVDTGGVPTSLGTPARTDYASWTRYFRSKINGQLVKILRYHDIPSTGDGTHITNYYVTAFAYDNLGRRQTIVRTSTSTVHQITQATFDVLGRVTEQKIDATNSGVDTNVNGNLGTLSLAGLQKARATTYDAGGVGDSHVTFSTVYYGTGAGQFVDTNFYRTYRGHLRGIDRENDSTAFGPYPVYDVDWMGRTTGEALYTVAPNWTTVLTGDGYTAYVATNSTNRNNWTKTSFDDLGRVYRTERYPGTEVANHFEVNNYYDRNDRVVCTGDKYGAHTEYAFDGSGRQYQVRTVTDVETTKYSSGAFQYRDPKPTPSIASMSTTGNDGLIEYSHTAYDASNNAIEEHTVEIHHTDADGIDGTTSYVRATTYNWYDDADRLTTSAYFGCGDHDDGAIVWQDATNRPNWPDPAPSASDANKLVTKYSYDALSGRLETVTDPAGVATKTLYDKLGRRTYVVERFVDFSPPSTGIGSGADDRVTAWTYNGLDQAISMTAYNGSESADQPTSYAYEDSYRANLVTKETYPDSTSGTDVVTKTYNLDGSLAERTDQRGVKIQYKYDDARRLKAELVATFGSSGIVDQAVQSITRGYDSMGRISKITSHGNATEDPNNTTNVLNQTAYVYNTQGLVSRSDQDHADTVGAGTAHLDVDYTYDASATTTVFDDGGRLETVLYPDNATSVAYTFGSSGTSTNIHDRLNRIAAIGGAHPVNYSYNGTRRLVITDMLNPDVKLDLNQGVLGEYPALDRFGRTIDHFWDGYGTTPDVSRVKHGYDYAGNRTWREDERAAANSKNHDEFYTYDGLHRLVNFDRGNLTGSPYSGISGTPDSEEDWTLDQLGNWSTFVQKTTGTTNLNQSRTHNDVNEIDVDNDHSNAPGASITASTGDNWIDPKYDAAGNMIESPKPGAETVKHKYVFDAWNRLVKVTDSAGTTVIATFECDGLHRRIVKIDSATNTTYDYYYNEQWQVLEQRKNGDIDPLAQFVWHPQYVDWLAIRYYDANTDNTLGNDDKQWYCQDANYNVVAIVNAVGTVLERYQYTPYGEPTVLDANFANDADGLTDIGNDLLFTGRERDAETGLQLNRNRYYHQQLGRWVSRDPIGYEGSEWNLYEYAGGMSTTSMDPFGESQDGPYDDCKRALRALCDACCPKEDQVKCRVRANQTCTRIGRAWNRTKARPGPNTSKDQVHGYLCWDWANLYDRTCKKCDSKEEFLKSEHRSIINDTPQARDRVHHYTRFCACGKNDDKCCIDIDDGWYDGDYIHPPGKLDSEPGWKPCPCDGRGGDEKIPIDGPPPPKTKP